MEPQPALAPKPRRGWRPLPPTPLDPGGAEGSRTPDLVNAIHALSQLSYSPTWLTANYKPISLEVNGRLAGWIPGDLSC